ncbi:MAG: hypothetical protein AAGD38_16430, partial [Acidobacteriota bacterium]
VIEASASTVVGLNAVIVAVTDEAPRVLVIPHDRERDSLPFGPLDPGRDRTLELALRGWVREQTGMELGYVEQLYTFGDRWRHPGERDGDHRLVTVGYLALVREERLTSDARWRPFYDYLPWEDRRDGRPAVVGDMLEPWLETFITQGPGFGAKTRGDVRDRRERVDIAFGMGGASWDSDRVLDRYELLYEARLVAEPFADRERPVPADRPMAGRAMAYDHRRILATALSRLRGKIRYRPVVFELLPDTFSLLQLQRVVEALSGMRLHKQNFRRLVEKSGLVEGTGQFATGTGGRPPELFRFRRDVLRERPSPGVGLPGLPGRQ